MGTLYTWVQGQMVQFFLVKFQWTMRETVRFIELIGSQKAVITALIGKFIQNSLWICFPVSASTLASQHCQRSRVFRELGNALIQSIVLFHSSLERVARILDSWRRSSYSLGWKLSSLSVYRRGHFVPVTASRSLQAKRLKSCNRIFSRNGWASLKAD